MKKSRYTEEQIAFALKQAELGTPISELCRKLGIAEQTFYRWKNKYGGMLPSDMKRLKQLEKENAKLKKVVADPSLDKLMLQDVLTKKFQGLPRSGKPYGICRSVLRQANAEAVWCCESTGDGVGGSRPVTRQSHRPVFQCFTQAAMWLAPISLHGVIQLRDCVKVSAS